MSTSHPKIKACYMVDREKIMKNCVHHQNFWENKRLTK
uniref:Uncharacterized protein n=1 Tax=Rhizophora mucronata TaxID=61149 RepID=A0A2P2QJM4_RHIMU